MVASRTPPTGDVAHNPGMCPDWQSNQRPFGSQVGTQSTEQHHPGEQDHIYLTESWGCKSIPRGWALPGWLIFFSREKKLAEFWMTEWAARLSNLRPTGRMRPRMVMNMAQHKIVNLLKTWDFFLWLRVAMYLMCGPETPKCWAPLVEWQIVIWRCPGHKAVLHCQPTSTRLLSSAQTVRGPGTGLED